MSKIHEIAVAIRDCSRVARVADARAELLGQYGDEKRIEGGPLVSVLVMHAEQVRDDAFSMRWTLEEELTVHVPATTADALTQMLVLSDYFHTHELTSGSKAERTVRLLIGRILEGLIAMGGKDSTPALEVYPHDNWLWEPRVREVETPLPGAVVDAPRAPKPFRVA